MKFVGRHVVLLKVLFLRVDEEDREYSMEKGMLRD
jgi:hypothetical protein